MKDFRKIAKLTLIFTIFTLLSKLFGFAVLIAYQFGPHTRVMLTKLRPHTLTWSFRYLVM